MNMGDASGFSLLIRRLGISLLALMLMMSLGISLAVADDVNTTDWVKEILENDSENATVGLYLKEVDGPVHANLNETVVFEPASTIKALVHYHAMRQVQDGATIDGEVVTLNREIPLIYGDISGSCPQVSGNDVDTLANGLEAMMVLSDNQWTQAMRDFFGDGNINNTRVALNMNDTALNHMIGCSGTGNELTLVDAGRLYEAVATGYLTEPTRSQAYALVSSDGGIFNSIIDQESAGMGLSSEAISQFKAGRRSALKAGSYELSGPKFFHSVAGWAELTYKDADCVETPRDFVYGAFIANSDTEPTGIRSHGVELFREQIGKALESWAECEADLEVADVQVIDPPTEINVNTDVPLTVRYWVRNNGPASAIDATLEASASAQFGCSVDPANAQVNVPGMNAGTLLQVDQVFTVSCQNPSFHDFEFNGQISPSNPNVNDPIASNNSGSDDLTVAVIAYADLAITDWDFSALDNAELGDLLVGETFVFPTIKTLHNFGDTFLNLYHQPVNATVSKNMVVPEGIVGSVHVGFDEAPANVTVLSTEGVIVHLNQPAGTVIEAEGPATLTVDFVVSNLFVGLDRVINEEFNLGCIGPGEFDIEFVNEIQPQDIHVLDPDSDNNVAEVSRTVECVTPVQINIRPGNQHNFVNPTSQQTIPVAFLTTEAGEYGLPIDFDATTIDHTTVRFGVQPILNQGEGSVASPDRNFIRDAHEMDDKTKDGDLDMVLLFKVNGTGIDANSTESCATGKYDGGGGNLYTFFGCDVVQVPPGAGKN